VRVFEQGSLGDIRRRHGALHRRPEEDQHQHVSCTFPVPGAGNDKSLRVFAFFDAGNVWARTRHMDLSRCAPRRAWA
jgi:outer membrane protein insertion porin family